MAYKPEERTAILETVRNARKKNIKWSDVLPLAKVAGFRGGLIALQAFVAKGKKRGPKPGGKRGPGRPKSSGRGSGRPKVVGRNAVGLDGIEAIVKREVDLRLRNARDAAIKAFNLALG